MSVSIVTPGLIRCDGGRWPCRAIVDAGTLCTAREARQEARSLGWTVEIRQQGIRRRRDLCPGCRQSDALAAGSEANR